MSRHRTISTSVPPLPDETAGSLVWRIASSQHRSVADFCTIEFGLSYSQARGDIDSSLTGKFSHRFSQCLRLGRRIVNRLRIAENLLVPAFRPSTKRCNQPVRICFDCLSNAPYGRRFWRTCLAVACPIHGHMLVSTCPNCGAEINYQEGNVGLAPLFWLETWPVCTNCLRTMRPNPQRADALLLNSTAKWNAALAGVRPYPWLGARSYLRLSARVLRWFTNVPDYVTARAMVAEKADISPHVATSLLLRRLWRGRVPPSIAQAALGVSFDPCQLAKDMVS